MVLHLQPLWYNRPQNLLNSVEKRTIKAVTAFEVIQGHRGRYQSKARMRLPIILININWYAISCRFGVIAAYCSNFGHFAFLSHPLGGLRDNVRCWSWAHWNACSGLPINVNCTFFAKCYGFATSEKRSKIGDFAPTRSLWSKISGIGRLHQ